MQLLWKYGPGWPMAQGDTAGFNQDKACLPKPKWTQAHSWTPLALAPEQAAALFLVTSALAMALVGRWVGEAKAIKGIAVVGTTME